MSIDTTLDKQQADEIRGALVKTLRIVLMGQPTHLALQVADAALTAFMEHLGGQRIYFPSRESIDEEAILAAFTGNNRDAVCEAFGISRATLYRLLRARSGARSRQTETGVES